jgi:two-component system response regulator HydG
MRDGAADYLTKPIDLNELRVRVGRELKNQALVQDNRALHIELDSRFGMEGIIGNAPNMKALFDLLRQAGPTQASILLLGESGTGKELFAHACHQLSPRRRRRFVAINCAALTETLIESELFGHAQGAFTGAQKEKEGKFQFADGGTLFLDEIGDMPLGTQANLLRVLEEGVVTPVGSNQEIAVDVRIVAATNRNLLERVKEGAFREDLYYRLNVVSLELPPLRDRMEDLPLLLEHFKQEFCKRHGKEIGNFSEDVLTRLRKYAWPGNVRELRNLVETMVVLDSDGILGTHDLPIALRDSVSTQPPAEGGGYSLAGKTLEEVEKDLILATLLQCGGNRQDAARQLGMGERTLYRKIKGYGRHPAK